MMSSSTRRIVFMLDSRYERARELTQRQLAKFCMVAAEKY